jgi:uncharacterized membrane protein
MRRLGRSPCPPRRVEYNDITHPIVSDSADPATGQAKEKEKCYGVAKAGQNDCANLTDTHSCAGQNKADNDPAEWKYVAKGTCKAMKGMTETEAKAKIKQ